MSTSSSYSEDIPHYQRAAQMNQGLPAMFSPEHEALMRERQHRACEAVVSGRWRESTWFEPITEPWVEACRGASLVVDLGAEVGFFSLLAARVMRPGGRLIAVEADPVFARLLRELPFPSGIEVDVINAAAWDEETEVELRRPRGCSATAAGVTGDVFRVPAVTVDGLLHGNVPAALKLDVEGAEARVFRGMRQMLEVGRTHILMEFHPWVEDVTPGGRQLMTDALLGAGYRIVRFYDDGPREMTYVGGRMHLIPPKSSPANAG